MSKDCGCEKEEKDNCCEEIAINTGLYFDVSSALIDPVAVNAFMGTLPVLEGNLRTLLFNAFLAETNAKMRVAFTTLSQNANRKKCKGCCAGVAEALRREGIAAVRTALAGTLTASIPTVSPGLPFLGLADTLELISNGLTDTIFTTLNNARCSPQSLDQIPKAKKMLIPDALHNDILALQKSRYVSGA